MSRKTFCDVCDKELTRNMVGDRLIVTIGEFTAEVIISKNGTSNDGDLCYDCLMSLLNTKPKRPYVRKEKPVALRLPEEKHPPEIIPTVPAVTDDKEKNFDIISHFTIHVPTEAELYYQASIGKHNYEAETARACVNGLLTAVGITLDEVKAAPDSEGKKQILAIMEEQ